MRKGAQRGFTLIELMVAVAIIGILSSIAIPSFSRMQLRARAAERVMLMGAIHRAMDEYWVRDGRFPYDDGAGYTLLYLMYDQPNTTPTTAKRPWRTTALNSLDHWNLLSLGVEGGVYYSYGGYAYKLGRNRVYVIYAYGDLDGDRAQNRWEKQWIWVDGTRQTYAGGTLACPECTVGYETNRWTF